MAIVAERARQRARDRPQTAPRVVGLVFQLELKRVALGLGQEAFADRLGVDRKVWYEIRHDKTRPPWDLMQRVLELWPGEFDALVPEVIRAWGSRRPPDAPRRCG